MATLTLTGLLSRLFAPLFVLLFVALLPSSAAGDDDKANVMQVDLVFPRNDTVYQPVYPFPIVFAISNSEAGWPYGTSLNWNLFGLYSDDREPDLIATGGIVESDTRVNISNSAEDQWLAIYDAPELMNSSFTELSLSVAFGAPNPCKEDRERSIELQPGTFMTISFNISSKGELPNVEAGGPCAVPVGAMGITDPKNIENSTLEGSCLIVAPEDEWPPVAPCAFRIGAEVASQVESKMLEAATCTTGSWPDPTGLVGPCIEDVEDSMATPLVNPAVTAVVGALMLCVAGGRWLYGL